MKKVLLLLSAVLLLNSCETDFKTTAPYKEVMVVYGLLDPNDSIQFIRVGKSFLGEGNVLVMSQQADSITYADDALEVTMEKQTGSQTQSYALTRIDTIDKETGIFNVKQKFYADVNPLNTSATYKLIVKNKNTGYTVSSKTGIVGNPPSIELPNPSASIDFAVNSELVIQFYAGQQARIYNVSLLFRYIEIDLLTADTTWKYFTWSLGQKLTSPGSLVEFRANRLEFFNHVRDNLVAEPNKSKKFLNYPDQSAIKPIDIQIIGVTEELNTFVSLANPSTGIVQDPPFYTNIENGIGIFSSRNISDVFYDFSSHTDDTLTTHLHYMDP
jgi:hypothetical protein